MTTEADGILETERKFEVTDSFTLPDLTGLPGVATVPPPHSYDLAATYYDTAGLRLLAARTTLRRRTGGTDEGWHLKLPAGADTRREHHAPLGADTAGVPEVLGSMVQAASGGEPLRPVARLRTARVIHQLLDGSGAVLAEVMDDRVQGAVPLPAVQALQAPGLLQDGNWQHVRAWREVEVELAAGPAELLASVGTRLCEAGARPSASKSKLAFVLAAAPPSDPRGPALT